MWIGILRHSGNVWEIRALLGVTIEKIILFSHPLTKNLGIFVSARRYELSFWENNYSSEAFRQMRINELEYDVQRTRYFFFFFHKTRLKTKRCSYNRRRMKCTLALKTWKFNMITHWTNRPQNFWFRKNLYAKIPTINGIP